MLGPVIGGKVLFNVSNCCFIKVENKIGNAIINMLFKMESVLCVKNRCAKIALGLKFSQQLIGVKKGERNIGRHL